MSDGSEARHGSVEGVWCYLAMVRGHLCAIPDDERTPLMPLIARDEHVVPLPFGIVPPFVRGLVNIGGTAELAIDLGAYVGLDGPVGANDTRRLIVLRESSATVNGSSQTLAFVVDHGFELVSAMPIDTASPDIRFSQGYVATDRGDAILLAIGEICAAVTAELGADRPWNGRGDPLIGV